MTKFVSKHAKCPYYTCEDTVSVYCEGLAPGGSTHIMLGSGDRCADHRKTYCNTFNYGNCPYAKAMNYIYGAES